MAEAPTADAAGIFAVGAAMGATLGGLALVATAIKGGVGGVMTAVVLIGGRAFAGGITNLFVSKGYETEADDHYNRAIERGQIVVGGEDHGQLAEANRILSDAGATRRNIN